MIGTSPTLRCNSCVEIYLFLRSSSQALVVCDRSRLTSLLRDAHRLHRLVDLPIFDGTSSKSAAAPTRPSIHVDMPGRNPSASPFPVLPKDLLPLPSETRSTRLLAVLPAPFRWLVH